MRTTTLGALILAQAAHCRPDPPDEWIREPSFVHHAEHVSLYGYGVDESQACAGSFEALVTHTRAVMDFRGVDDSAWFEYRWMSNEHWNQLYPPPAVMGAITSAGVPHTRWLPDMHEIVHMVGYREPHYGCPRVLEEGLADYLGDPEFTEVHPSGQLRELLIAKNAPSPGDYARAAHFVSFVVETRGPEALMRLCAAVGTGETLPQWDSGIRWALGVSLDELLAQYATYPICSQQQLRARTWECAGPIDHVFQLGAPSVKTISRGGSRYVVDHTGCADPRATNLISSPRHDAAIRRLVRFPEDATIDVSVGRGAIFVSQECVPCSADPQIVREGPAEPRLHSYRAGVHAIVVFFDRRDEVRLQMVQSSRSPK